jgi:hypothetical protein
MGQVYCVVPPPDDPISAAKFESLVAAIDETNTVAIVSYCRNDTSSPKLYFLTYHTKGYAYMIPLPFSNDIKVYPTYKPSNKQSTTEMKVSMDAFIDRFELDDETGNPKHIFNPAYQNIKECIVHRAIDPKAPLPKTTYDMMEPNITNTTESKHLLTLYDLKHAQLFTPETESPLLQTNDLGTETE